MKNKIFVLFIVLFMLNILYCTAEYSEKYNDYEVINLKCYGDLTIKLYADNDLVEDEYSFVNCRNTELELWLCKCNEKNTSIILKTLSSITNIYDINIQYYINQIPNEDSKRIKKFINFDVYANEYKPPSAQIEWPELNQKYLIIGVISFIFLIIIGGILLIIMLFFRDKNKLNNKKPNIYKYIKNIKK